MRFIGDVHGKFERYYKVIEGVEESLQVGDMGVGFPDGRNVKMAAGHHFIRGNHDNPDACSLHPNYVPDGTMDRGIYCVGGALSIDKAWRTDGIDYWSNEELSQRDFQVVIDNYKNIKPKIVVTHDGPDQVIPQLFRQYNKFCPSITRQAFDFMLDEHAPDIWIFGHWHEFRDVTIGSTRFIVLPELGFIDLEI